MYSAYSKDGLLLHLGQEHSVGKVISFEYIFITNMLTVWSISKELDSHLCLIEFVCALWERVVSDLSCSQAFFQLWQKIHSCFYSGCPLPDLSLYLSTVLLCPSCAGFWCISSVQCSATVLFFFFPSFSIQKEVNDSLKVKALILAKFALN